MQVLRLEVNMTELGAASLTLLGSSSQHTCAWAGIAPGVGPANIGLATRTQIPSPMGCHAHQPHLRTLELLNFQECGHFPGCRTPYLCLLRSFEQAWRRCGARLGLGLAPSALSYPNQACQVQIANPHRIAYFECTVTCTALLASQNGRHYIMACVASGCRRASCKT